MDELVNKVSEKAGINPEQAKNAVNTVLEFLKAKAPAIGEQITSVLAGGGGGGAGGLVDSVRKKIGI